MKICTVAVFLGLVAAAYSSCLDSRLVGVGPTVSISTGGSSIVGETISCADNPSLIVVNAELYSPVVSTRYIIVSIEIGCDGSRTLRCIDSLTGNVICLPIFYDSRSGLDVVVIPLTGEFAYFVPNSGCSGFTFYLIYISPCDGSVYLLDVLTGNLYLAQIGCYGDVVLIPVSSFPEGVIQLRREVRVSLITTYGVQKIFITDIYTQSTFSLNLYEITEYGLLITSDNVFGLEYVLKISDCGVVTLDRAYLTLGRVILTKTIDSTFVKITRNSLYTSYVTVETSISVMAYVKASTSLRASITEVNSVSTLEITNINSGIVKSYGLNVGPKSLNFIVDTQGHQFFVYNFGGTVTLYSVYYCGDLYYVVNYNTKQIQLLDVDVSGSPVFYPAESISLSSLSVYSLDLTYRIVMTGSIRYIIGENLDTGYSFKNVLRVVNSLFVYRDELIQMDLLVIDTQIDLPTVHECWITKQGIMIIHQVTLRLVYVTFVDGLFVYTDVESGSVNVEIADTDFVYWMTSSSGISVC